MQRPEVNAYVEPAAPPLPLRAVVPPAISAASAHSSNGSSNGHVQLAVSSNSSRSRKHSRSAWRMVAAVSLVVVLGVGLGAIGIIASRNPNVAKNGPKENDKAIVKKNTTVPGKTQGTKPKVDTPL